MTVAELVAENALLREFYDSWCFFHGVRAEKSDMGEEWDRKRLEMAAQSLSLAHDRVAAHIRSQAH